MVSKAPLSENSSLGPSQIEYVARGWLLDCEIRQHSRRTLDSRKDVLDKLQWFLREKEMVADAHGIRAFFLYVNRGHLDPDGRWGPSPLNANGNPIRRKMDTPVSPGTVVSYFNILRSFFAWAIEAGDIEVSPMAKMKPPVDRPDQIQPFTAAQVEQLEIAAKRGENPHRDTAILMLLLDTGLRASEVCGLRASDLDLGSRSCRVEGKGGKERSVWMGKKATKALWAYIRTDPREGSAPLFVSDRGHTPGEALTRNGMGQIIRRLGRQAKLENARCSPHTFRHTFAIEFLRNGGDQFTLMQILGHTDLKMTSRYLALAKADMEKQQRAFSPADGMGKRK